MNIPDKPPGLAACCLLLYVFTCFFFCSCVFLALMFGVGTFREH
jgi:hypothetical protein